MICNAHAFVGLRQHAASGGTGVDMVQSCVLLCVIQLAQHRLRRRKVMMVAVL